MRPIYLSFKAFGPYIKKQEIDFETLEKSGLYLICGETGSGKTTILDAMSYALYGMSSGGGRGDIGSMRCQMADDKEDTEVEYIFESNHRIYKFTRSVRFGRKNFNTFQNVFIKNDDGIFEPIYANPKIKDVEQKATELIGLTYEQFRQVIVLPQGQFEKLLTSTSDEKEKILVSLFDADKWQRVADIVHEKAKQAKDKLTEEFADIQFVLRDNGCETTDELFSLLTAKKEEYTALENENAAFAKALKNEREQYEKSKELCAGFDELEKLKIELNRLMSEKEKYSHADEIIAKSDAAASLRPLCDKKTEAALGYDRRASQLKKLSQVMESAKAATDASNSVLAELELKSQKVAEAKNQISSMKALIPIYENGEKIAQRKRVAKAEYDKHAAELDIWNKKLDVRLRLEEEAKRNLALAYDECAGVFRLYSQTICATLSGELKDGNPCPVCGSTHHPSPAHPGGASVTEQQKNNAQKRLEKAQEEAKTAEKETAKISEKLGNIKAAFENVRSEYEKSEESARVFEQTKIAQIDTLAQLKDKITAFENSVIQYEDKKKTAMQNAELCERRFAQAAADVKTAEAELKDARLMLKRASDELCDRVAQCGFKDEEEAKKFMLPETEKQNLIDRAVKYKNDLASVKGKISLLEKELSDKEKPDLEKQKAYLAACEKNSVEKANRAAVAKSKLEKTTSDFEHAAKRMEKYQKDIIIAESDLQFARQIRGDLGIGLQRYMLAVMLSAVTSEANKLLSEVHGGRYKLFRTSSTALGRTRKSGLELEVADSFSGERRSVVSLSGGEKFLAALSLSIGLSSVVMAQSGGLKLGAMFIDEGFGSLDPSSISDALAVLSHVKNAKGSVGIISHVSALKETISARVEITKGRDGSSCRTVIG